MPWLWNQWNLGVPGFAWKTHRRNGLKFEGEHPEGMIWNLACWCILIAFRTWSLSNFLILMQFWSSERGFRPFSGKGMGGMAWNLACYIPWPPSKLIKFWAVVLIFRISVQFRFSEADQIWGFRPLTGERMGRMTSNLACWCTRRSALSSGKLLAYVYAPLPWL